MNAREYPIRPLPGDDPRFTTGLVLDVASVLETQGYPKVTGIDWVDLRQALWGFLYGTRRGEAS
ncbi:MULTISPECIES: hypothetical protein [unclassified Streptomyces]|uniref:hypothetical protein n=1 Tax=unclassified Streptomyces TaxID=2593676 RepID=UPI00278C1857|nr:MULTISPECIES: hypothetical protein [unclassified Streptomyces]